MKGNRCRCCPHQIQAMRSNNNNQSINPILTRSYSFPLPIPHVSYYFSYFMHTTIFILLLCVCFVCCVVCLFSLFVDCVSWHWFLCRLPLDACNLRSPRSTRQV